MVPNPPKGWYKGSDPEPFTFGGNYAPQTHERQETLAEIQPRTEAPTRHQHAGST